MPLTGISTGALAVRDDLAAAVSVLNDMNAIELNVGFLGRETQLDAALAHQCHPFSYVSIHIPDADSRFDWEQIGWFAEEVDAAAVIAHPHSTPNPEWARFGSRLCFEGLDHRSLQWAEPDVVAGLADTYGAGMIADCGHTQYIDPTGMLTRRWLETPIRHWHASVIDHTGYHHPPSDGDKPFLDTLMQRAHSRGQAWIWEEIPPWHSLSPSRYGVDSSPLSE